MRPPELGLRLHSAAVDKEAGPSEPLAETATLDDPTQEAMRLVKAAATLDVPLRLIGGVAVWFRCPSARKPPLARTYGDIDFVSISKHNASLTGFFEANGYEADKMFNALHGAQRLNFTDRRSSRPIDVLLDRFVMCHTLDLKARLTLDDTTVTVSDLFLTKAQVIQLNEKDIKDLIALLVDHGSDAEEQSSIDLDRLTAATRSDWGLEPTVRKTLAEVESGAQEVGLDEMQMTEVKSAVARLVAALDEAPKSQKWRMRARIGERIRWYDEPEEARR